MGSETVCPRGGVSHFYGASVLGFLLLTIFICLVLNPYFIHLRILPCIHAISQPRFIPMNRPMGRLSTTPLLTSKEFSSQEVSLDFENEKCVVSFSWSGPSLLGPTGILEFLSTGEEIKLLSLGGVRGDLLLIYLSTSNLLRLIF